jgi:hypothetical protein
MAKNTVAKLRSQSNCNHNATVPANPRTETGDWSEVQKAANDRDYDNQVIFDLGSALAFGHDIGRGEFLLSVAEATEDDLMLLEVSLSSPLADVEDSKAVAMRVHRIRERLKVAISYAERFEKAYAFENSGASDDV